MDSVKKGLRDELMNKARELIVMSADRLKYGDTASASSQYVRAVSMIEQAVKLESGGSGNSQGAAQ